MLKCLRSPGFVGLLMAAALTGCSREESQRIARDAISSSLRSACTNVRNCTVDCTDGSAKCTESP